MNSKVNANANDNNENENENENDNNDADSNGNGNGDGDGDGGAVLKDVRPALKRFDFGFSIVRTAGNGSAAQN
ncbi:GH10041 [Drosophila grimshawi]|uniref:GH10041 n=1 Tax=Drosophila grimshawi TaxID=7222 RepID=B4JTC1_DROGR|nr:GH10041 [Drosophila grimshawi]